MLRTEKSAKFPYAPTAPKPGPMLPVQAITDESVVIMSRPSSETMSIDAAMTIIYVAKKTEMPLTTGSSTVLRSSLTVSTLRGLIAFLMSRKPLFRRTMSLETLIPPPVEPAHAPTIIRNNRTNFAIIGQVSKLAVENPVVVIIEATWNNERRNESPRLCLVAKRLAAIIMTELVTMPRYQRSSSLLRACLPCLMRII